MTEMTTKIKYFFPAIIIAALLHSSFTTIKKSEEYSVNFFLTEIYVMFDLFEGGSMDPDHLNWSDVVDMSGGFQVINSQPEFKRLSLTIKRDKGTPSLHMISLENRLVKNIQIEQMRMRPQGGKYKYLEIKLMDVQVEFIDIGSSDLVRVDLIPKLSHYTYRRLLGNGDTDVYQYGWDYGLNQEWDGT